MFSRIASILAPSQARLSTGRATLIRDRLGRLSGDTSGSVAIIFALIGISLCLFVGAAVDLGRWLQARQQSVAALDAAVLAGARVLQLDEQDLTGARVAAQQYFTENTKGRTQVVEETVSFDAADSNTAFTGSNRSFVETTFLNFAHISRLPVAAYSKAVLGADKDIEISLMLDVTGSMAGTKIADLKAAATDLVEIVITDNTNANSVRVALVPYANSVNAGGYADKVRGTISSGTCINPGCQKFRFKNAYNQDRTFGVSACVSERTGADAYTDANPTKAPLGKNYPSPNNPCLTNTIVPLTKNKTALNSAISVLKASGSTGGHIGVAWGWYLLSPNWESIFPTESKPAANNPDKVLKIAVLMTDGEYNSAYCKGVISQDSTSGSGSAEDHINCNAPNGHAFNQSMSLCTSMKSAGITVYAVGFDVVNDKRAKDLMTHCATDAAHLYLASNGAELKQAFRDIALKINQLYLTQ